ncbi:MAG: molybdenum ABC transporter ATP-binding protein [Chromatiales bacterium]|nr:molybdenum ABC transporter ATP-binding protein [Chromatiales bacterium]
MRLIARFRLERRAGFSLSTDLDLPCRGVTAIFGESGSGKTTLLRCIAGLERAGHGLLRLGNAVWQDDARGLFLPTHRRPLGYVFQHAALFDHLSVAGNLDYALRRTPRDRRRVDRDDIVELLGLRTLLDQSAPALSGGERQRVGMARALLTSPSLLLMDEPLAALDERNKREILPYLERLHRELEIPVLYVSHSVEEVARLADHVVLMDGGHVQGAGPIGEMLSAPGLALARDRLATSIFEARSEGYDETSGLSRLQSGIGALYVAQRLDRDIRCRLRIQARDVGIARHPPVETSIVNCLPTTLRGIEPQGEHEVLLRLGGDGQLLALITRHSCRQLALAPGQEVYALIKSVAVEA